MVIHHNSKREKSLCIMMFVTVLFKIRITCISNNRRMGQIYSSSQPGEILAPTGHLVISRDIFDCPSGAGRGYWHLVSRGQVGCKPSYKAQTLAAKD